LILIISKNRLAITLLIFSFASLPIWESGWCQSSSSLSAATQEDSGEQHLEEDTNENQDATESEKLESDQKRLSDKYKLLEEKLFSLHQYERDNNPTRSKLLERAYTQSQEKMTSSQMKLIVNLITKAKLKDAENEQDEVLANLNQLLELLQSEDRGKRVRDAITRNQEYLKEVERILRIQKGVRGQAEGGVDANRLANSQQKLAERTKQLQEQMQLEDPNDQDDPEESKTSGSNKEADGNQEPSEKRSDIPSGEPKQEEPETNEDKGENFQPKFGEGESAPTEGAQPSPPGQGKSGAPDSSDSNPQSRTRQRIQSAEQRMRDAQKNLEDARRNDAIEEMKKAEREMALAKKELEEILRQLRKEEVERTLAMLEGRFRKMLERETRLAESTRKLDTVISEQRGTEFEIRSGKLAVEQSEIATR